MANNNKKGVVLDGRAREIVGSVDDYFVKEKEQAAVLLDAVKHNYNTEGLLEGPIAAVRVDTLKCIIELLYNSTLAVSRVVAATGVNKNTVLRLRKERRGEVKAPHDSGSGKRGRPKKKQHMEEDKQTISLAKNTDNKTLNTTKKKDGKKETDAPPLKKIKVEKITEPMNQTECDRNEEHPPDVNSEASTSKTNRMITINKVKGSNELEITVQCENHGEKHDKLHYESTFIEIPIKQEQVNSDSDEDEG